MGDQRAQLWGGAGHRAGVADSEPVCAPSRDAHVQRQHPAGPGGDLGVLRRALLRAGGTSLEGRAAADGDDRPVGPPARKRLQHVDEVKRRRHSGLYPRDAFDRI